MIRYIVQLKRSLQPCWLCSVKGDPGRTLCIESATQFKSEESAKKAIAKTIRQNPHRKYTEEDFYIAELRIGAVK